METGLFFGFAYLIPGLWFLFLWLYGLFPGTTKNTVGTLAGTHTRKNVRTRSGYTFKRITDYKYTYTVNEKNYKIKGRGYHTRKYVPRKVTVVYLQGFPRCAYIEDYTGTRELILAFFFLVNAGIFLSMVFGGQTPA